MAAAQNVEYPVDESQLNDDQGEAAGEEDGGVVGDNYQSSSERLSEKHQAELNRDLFEDTDASINNVIQDIAQTTEDTTTNNEGTTQFNQAFAFLELKAKKSSADDDQVDANLKKLFLQKIEA